jgi:pimeloyl-ACP methyl ester carboxylesterase
MAGIEERTIEVDGIEVFFREVPGDGPPAVFVHGNPTNSQIWVPFLERISGPAVALDLPGWGRSARPSDLDYTMHGLAEQVDRFLAILGIEGYRLVVQDWGSLALIGAQRDPDRVQRLVVFNSVPLLPGYRWHWMARWFWRRPGLGELFNAAANRPAIKQLSRQGTADRTPLPDDYLDLIWSHWDRGMSRAMLALYRSADSGALEAAGSRLGELRCPALVVWGDRDPNLAPRFGRDYAERLPNAEMMVLPDAGHWPWLDRPDVIDRVVDFLDAGPLA